MGSGATWLHRLFSRNRSWLYCGKARNHIVVYLRRIPPIGPPLAIFLASLLGLMMLFR